MLLTCDINISQYIFPLERGFDVYLIDWGVPSHADRGLRLDDYVSGRLTRVIDFILRDQLPPPGKTIPLMRGPKNRHPLM